MSATGPTGLNEFVDDYGNPGYFLKDDIQYSDFTSNMDISDVYTIKNYDKQYFLLTFATFYGEDKSTEFVRIWTCFDGLSVSSGADIFDLYDIDRQLTKIRYCNGYWFDDSKDVLRESDVSQLKKVVKILKKAEPLYVKKGSLPEQEYKYLQLEMKNGLEIDLHLGQNGTLIFQDIVFQLNEKDFQWLWNELE